MDSDTGHTKRRKPRSTPWRRRHWRSLLVLTFLIALVACWFVWRLEKRTAWQAAQRQARDLGVVQTTAEFEARFGPIERFRNEENPMAPDSPYQAVVTATALPPRETMADLPTFSDRHPSIALREVPYPEATLVAMTDYATVNRDTLLAIHEAAQSGVVPDLASEQRGIVIYASGADS